MSVSRYTIIFWRQRTVNMEERQERDQLITLAGGPSCGLQVARLSSLEHHRVRDDVAMCEHDALGVAGGPRRVNQEGQIFSRVLCLCAPPLRRACGIDDAGEMLDCVRRVFLITHDNNSVKRDTNLLRSSLRILDVRELCDNGFRA